MGDSPSGWTIAGATVAVLAGLWIVALVRKPPTPRRPRDPELSTWNVLKREDWGDLIWSAIKSLVVISIFLWVLSRVIHP